MADTVHSVPGEAQGHATVEHAEPMLLGFAPPVAVVSTSMIVLLAILVWKGVPKLITGGLDSKIAEIKAQLAEAKTLRAEAEALQGIRRQDRERRKGRRGHARPRPSRGRSHRRQGRA